MDAFVKRWATYKKERFEPFTHFILILAFYSANVFIASLQHADSKPVTPYSIPLGFILVLLVFFHLRLFDDMKDFEYDCRVNKERPLPRGLIGIEEFNAVTFAVILVEIIIALILGAKVFSTYMLLLGFTLLMRMEFFIGKWLRPKMEIYAVSHTFSAALMGLLIWSIYSGKPFFDIPRSMLFFALVNWFVFNVYEIGRKTFAPDEEKTDVDSYSQRLGNIGAFLFLAFNVMIALYLLLLSLYSIKVNAPEVWRRRSFAPLVILVTMVTMFTIISGIVYAVKPESRFAKFYRMAVNIFLLSFNVIIAVAGFFFT